VTIPANAASLNPPAIEPAQGSRGGQAMLRKAGLLVAMSLLAAGASAGSITQIEPLEGALGTAITIQGLSFGSGPGKVKLLSADGHAFPLAVTSWSTDEISVIVKHGQAGSFALVVDEAGSSPPVVAAEVFVLHPPVPSQVLLEDGSALPGEVVTLQGAFFGSHPGHIRVGKKHAKVLGWSDAAVQFRVPKKLASGAWDVRVTTPLGMATLAEGLAVVGGTAKFGKLDLDLLADDELLQPKLEPDAGMHPDGVLVVHGEWHVPWHSRQLRIEVPIDASTSGIVLVDATTPGFSATYETKDGGFGTSPVALGQWTSDPSLPFALTVLAGGGQRAGAFSGTLINIKEGSPLVVSGEYVVKDIAP